MSSILHIILDITSMMQFFAFWGVLFFLYLCQTIIDMNYIKKDKNKKSVRLSEKAMKLEDKAERIADAGAGNLKRASRVMGRSQKAWEKSRKSWKA